MTRKNLPEHATNQTRVVTDARVMTCASAFRFSVTQRNAMELKGLSVQLVSALEQRVHWLQSDYGIAPVEQIRDDLRQLGFDKEQIDDFIKRASAARPAVINAIEVWHEAEGIADQLVEASKAIGRLHDWTVDKIDAVAAGQRRTQLLLSKLRSELHAHAAAARECAKASKTTRTKEQEQKRVAAFSVASVFRTFGEELSATASGPFVLALGCVFDALDLGDNNSARNWAHTVRTELGLPKGKPRGRRGRMASY